jgi:hypothetical protein
MTRYAKLVFLHPVESAGYVVHSDASIAQNISALFFMLGTAQYIFKKSAPGTLRQTCVFASGGICGSRSAFRCDWGMRCRCTFFRLRWDRCGFQKKAHQDTLCRTCGLHSVGYAGHLVHSRASGARKVDALFFMLMWY